MGDTTRINAVAERTCRLYGDESGAVGERLRGLMERRTSAGVASCGDRWNERDVLLITYGDMVTREGERPLVTLARFLRERLTNCAGAVHILPFCPWTSDDGFSVTDYREVDAALGGWKDIEAIAGEFDLMADVVLNHCSRSSEWFESFIRGIAPERDYFVTAEPGDDLSGVTRPRTSPLLHEVQTVHGSRHVWTTFSADQVDLNFANPDVLLEFLDIILMYVSRGARILRLDAIAYLWKRIGTPCIHLPETHEVVRIIRGVLEVVAPHVIVLTETNVPHAENVSYFGDGDEAHMVYQFALPPLLLHGLTFGTAEHLMAWASGLGDVPEGCTFLNFTASHDGIGVRPLEGIVRRGEIEELAERVRMAGGMVSLKRNSDGSETPYELNVTYYDSLGMPGEADEDAQVTRFLTSQAVMLGMRGVPAVYFNNLMGCRNWTEGFERTKRARTLNRRKWGWDELRETLDDATTREARIYEAMLRMMEIRRGRRAFHPEARMKVLEMVAGVFGFERASSDGEDRIVCLHNMTGGKIEVGVGVEGGLDLLEGSRQGEMVLLGPWQSRWVAGAGEGR